MPITLPKPPEKETLKMLIRANSFHNHAMQHANLGSEIDVMISIHNLDNAIEYTLRILISHLDIEEVTGKTINSCEIAQLIGEIQRFLNENSNVALSFVQEIKKIRELRNMVQHAIILPVSEVERYLDYGIRFFKRTLEKFFGISYNEIKLSFLVKSEPVRNFLHDAESNIDSGKYLESIVCSRNAFDYARFIYNNDGNHRLRRAPALSELRTSSPKLYSYLQDIDNKISLDMFNIDVNRYLHYMEFIECIPYEYQSDWHWNTELDRPWEKRDAEDCYLFVTDAVLHWELKENKPIQSPHFTESSTLVRLIKEVCGVDIGAVFVEYGCFYFEEDNKANLFYCNKQSIKILKEELQKSVITIAFKRYTSDVLDIHHTNFSQIINHDIRLIMNEPPTWEVIINYRDIPLTMIDHLDTSNTLCIDDYNESTIFPDNIIPGLKNSLLAARKKIPLVDSIEKAFEFYNIIKDEMGDQDLNLVSQNLINMLSNVE